MAKKVKVRKMSKLLKKGMSPALAGWIKAKNAGKAGWGKCR